MAMLTDEGLRIANDVAQRHGVSTDAVITLMNALQSGGGTMAQFSHPDLGGMGQWALGGMIMVGDMFNQGLKYRVDSLCSELSSIMRGTSVFAPPPVQAPGAGSSLFVGGGNWWPSWMGVPSSSGGQNSMSYAYFAAARRLAISLNGQVSIYDTLDHHIGGFSQQQGGDQSLTFSSQYGTVRVADLPQLGLDGIPLAAPMAAPMAVGTTPSYQAAPAQTQAATDIFASIEQLASLAQKGVLTDAEFASKKAELLSRL